MILSEITNPFKDKIKKKLKGYERLIKDSPSAGVEVSYDSNYLLGF